MIKTGKTPSQLLEYLYSKVGPHYYNRYDYHVTPDQHRTMQDKLTKSQIDSVAGRKVAKLNKTDGFKYILEDGSWLLLRFSGTEPLIRIYSESHSTQEVERLLENGKAILGI